MSFIKRNWTILLACALVPAIGLLLVFQLSWIGDMRERERTRLKQGLYASVAQLARSFQAQIGIMPSLLLSDPEALASARDEPALVEAALGNWRAIAAMPEMLVGLYLSPRGEAVLEWRDSGFVPLADGALARTLRDGQVGQLTIGEPLLLADRLFLFFPLLPERSGWLALELDGGLLFGSLIPALADASLYGKGDYLYRVVDRYEGRILYESEPGLDEAAFRFPDMRMPLFRPESFRPERFTGGLAFDKGEIDRMALEEREPDLGRSRWLIEAARRGGSLARAVDATALRSAILSSAVLLALAATILFLAFSERRARELARRQAEFASAVSHELKTPLAVIKAGADNLADGIVSDGARIGAYGKTIRAECQRLSAMIDGLLLYSRLGKAALRDGTPVDLALLAEEVLEGRGAELKEARLRVETSLPAGRGLVMGDRALLMAAIDNLVLNVLRHAKEGGYLGLFLGRSGSGRKERIVLRVEDRGPGLPKAERQLAFESFFRGEAARREQRPGSGIGLSLVRRVARAHGGEASFEVKDEGGASVRLSMPPFRTRPSGRGKAER